MNIFLKIYITSLRFYYCDPVIDFIKSMKFVGQINIDLYIFKILKLLFLYLISVV